MTLELEISLIMLCTNESIIVLLYS